MSAEFFVLEDDLQACADVLNETEAQPSSSQRDSAAPGPDITALREKLSLLACQGKTKQVLRVSLGHDQIKRLTDKEVEKYIKRYKTYVGSKTTERLIDSTIDGTAGFLTYVGKQSGHLVEIDNAAIKQGFKNNFSVSEALSSFAGKLYLWFGGALAALVSAGAIIAKNVTLTKIEEPANCDKKPEVGCSENVPEDCSPTVD